MGGVSIDCGQGEAGRKTDGVLALYCLLATVPSCVCWTSDCPQRTANKWSQSSNPTSESGYLCLCHHSYKLNDKVLAWLLSEKSGIAPQLIHVDWANFRAFSLKRHIFSYKTTEIHRNGMHSLCNKKRLLSWFAVGWLCSAFLVRKHKNQAGPNLTLTIRDCI